VKEPSLALCSSVQPHFLVSRQHRRTPLYLGTSSVYYICPKSRKKAFTWSSSQALVHKNQRIKIFVIVFKQRMLVRGHVGHFSLIDQLRNDCFEFLVVSLRSLSSQVIDQQTAGPRRTENCLLRKAFVFQRVFHETWSILYFIKIIVYNKSTFMVGFLLVQQERNIGLIKLFDLLYSLEISVVLFVRIFCVRQLYLTVFLFYIRSPKWPKNTI